MKTTATLHATSVRAAVGSVLAVLALSGAAAAAHIPLPGGTFDDGLQGWQVEISPSSPNPSGSITVQSGAAELREGTAMMVSLRQTFAVPFGALALRFDITQGPNWATQGNFLPDAFEAHLLRADGQPAVAPWSLGSTAAFSWREPTTTHPTNAPSMGQGTTFTPAAPPDTPVAQVRIPLTTIATGEALIFVASLIGGDGDHTSTVRIDNVVIELDINDPPIANAGPPQEFPCGLQGPVTLDGSASSDPEGQPLTYAWRDSDNNVLGETPQVQVSPPQGTHIYTLIVTDNANQSAQATTTIEVGTYGPGCACHGLLGDVNGSGQVNVADVLCTVYAALSYDTPSFPPACIAGPPDVADLDCNSTINVVDVQILIRLALSLPLGPALDTNGDGCPDACLTPPPKTP